MADRSSTADTVASEVEFVPAPDAREELESHWAPVVVRRQEIEQQIERLADGPMPETGNRKALIVHPESNRNSFTPGIRVSIEVLLPGESIRPLADNSSSVSFCIKGGGQATVDDQVLDFSARDTWSVPNLTMSSVQNNTNELQARLVFSDAPLLEALCARYIDEDFYRPGNPDYVRDPLADYTYQMPSGGGGIRTYSALIDPEIVEQRALIWRWDEVRDYLNGMDKSAKDQRAALIALLWNPATGRTNGSTNTLTAYMSGGVDPSWRERKYRMARPHRHTVTAINYSVQGDWRTKVAGREILWYPGDMVFTAPSWATHANGSCDQEPYTFTVQDAALHSALNASLFQEYMRKPPILLGSHPGFRAAEEPDPERVAAPAAGSQV